MKLLVFLFASLRFSPPKSLIARSRPACIAEGVSSGTPSTASPIPKTPATVVSSLRHTICSRRLFRISKRVRGEEEGRFEETTAMVFFGFISSILLFLYFFATAVYRSGRQYSDLPGMVSLTKSTTVGMFTSSGIDREQGFRRCRYTTCVNYRKNLYSLFTFPLLVMATPRFSSPSPCVSAVRPVAARTVSNSCNRCGGSTNVKHAMLVVNCERGDHFCYPCLGNPVTCIIPFSA